MDLAHLQKHLYLLINVFKRMINESMINSLLQVGNAKLLKFQDYIFVLLNLMLINQMLFCFGSQPICHLFDYCFPACNDLYRFW